MAVSPLPSSPSVTSSAVEEEEKPDGPRPWNGHISLSLSLARPVEPQVHMAEAGGVIWSGAPTPIWPLCARKIRRIELVWLARPQIGKRGAEQDIR
ncbi:hypothetical protein B296_00023626 [Ensete ventricosum]|uniref:Uncharacterized protein n=1 Tax=Ensete ventricosum TaxID=4639 RepID=A0A427ABA9_ENSVE|nr:hypothetical protein B296_00023626 [Ensete ventricosum]